VSLADIHHISVMSAGMFKDPSFQVRSVVDKRGRKVRLAFAV
jgi:hypothetical protein